jgi:hypothetical protein
MLRLHPMNASLRPRDITATTQAAEGLMRRRWSLAGIEGYGDKTSLAPAVPLPLSFLPEIAVMLGALALP